MTQIKKGDFIEIEFTGRTKETNKIFDLTSEELAKKENLYNPEYEYGPRIICIGQKHVIEGLDKALEEKNENQSFTLELKPEQAFGKKDPKLIKTVPTETLKKQNINPIPGLQINASGILGTIRTVTPGRTTIDFNHPLAGKSLIYEVKINKIITDTKEKLQGLISALLRLRKKDYSLELKEKIAEIKVTNIPDQIKEEFKTKAKELIPDIEITFA